MASRHITTDSAVKSILGKVEGDQDAVLDLIIGGVSARMESYIGMPVVKQRIESERQISTGTNSIVYLDNGPIVSVTSLTLAGSALTPSTDVTPIGRGLMRVDASGGPIIWGAGVIAVTYWSGYEQGAIPDDLVLACAMQSAHEYRQTKASGSDRLGLESSAPETGEAQTFVTDAWLPEVLATLNRYRKVSY